MNAVGSRELRPSPFGRKGGRARGWLPPCRCPRFESRTAMSRSNSIRSAASSQQRRYPPDARSSLDQQQQPAPPQPTSPTIYVYYGTRSVKARVDKEVPLEEVVGHSCTSPRRGMAHVPLANRSASWLPRRSCKWQSLLPIMHSGRRRRGSSSPRRTCHVTWKGDSREHLRFALTRLR